MRRRPAVVLRVTAVRKSFGSRQVLRGVGFEARAGRLVGIVGENGSGKTTLPRILSGGTPQKLNLVLALMHDLDVLHRLHDGLLGPSPTADTP